MALAPQDETNGAAAAVQTELKKVLESKAFASSEQLRGFLRYTVLKTVQGQGDQIKEYAIGVDVFGRGEAFDPRADSIVRAQAAKLRARLEKYYATEGQDADLLIEYPKGGYTPVFRKREMPGRRLVPTGRVAIAAAAIVVVGVAVWAALQFRRKPPVDAAVPSIAVLPFVDMSAQKDQDYLCDGLTEELINGLANIDGLRVVARTSAFEFKGKGRDIRKIGEQLNVRAVLEGSIRRNGDQLRITAQLNDASNGYHLWSKTFDRDLKDVFTIQEEISQAIVETLRVNLAPHKVPVKHYPNDVEAYELYLKGRQFVNTITVDGVKSALNAFQQALARDPEYAPAYAGLAEAYYWLAMRSGLPPKEAFPKAKEAALKAIQMDDRLAEGHSSLAAVLYSYDWDWDPANREFQRALELSPNNAAIRYIYARYLTSMTRLDDAQRQIRRAEELDPLALAVKQHAATVCFLRHEFDRALEEDRRMLALDPNFYMAYSGMGTAFLGLHRDREALEAAAKAVTLSANRDPMPLTWFGTIAGLTGNREKAEAVLHQLQEMSQQRYVRPIFIGHIYAVLGDKDRAFVWLERAFAERDVQLSFLRSDFRWDPLRTDPRFSALFKRMRLP